MEDILCICEQAASGACTDNAFGCPHSTPHFEHEGDGNCGPMMCVPDDSMDPVTCSCITYFEDKGPAFKGVKN